jgi:tRNA-dihydrouridine synthase B
VSLKTRLGWDDSHKDWQELVRVAALSGAAFACVHGRTRAQGYSGDSVLPVKPNLPIPIIANGDTKTISDIDRVQNLGYDGAMLGRAMLGKPWIFGCVCGSCDEPKNIGNIVLKHLNLMIEYYGAKSAIPMFRKHAAWYSSGMPNSTQFRIKVNQITDEKELQKTIKEFWSID